MPDEKLNLPHDMSLMVLDSLKYSIAVLDCNGRIVYVNEAWKRFADENEAHPGTTGVGINYLDICQNSSADSQSAVKALMGIKEVINRQKPSFSMEYPCDSENEKRWFILEAAPLSGTDCHVVVLHYDITGRKLVEDELKESEGRYHALFESVRSVILLIEPETGQIMDANTAALSFYGYSFEEIKKMNIARIDTLSCDEIHQRITQARESNSRTFNFHHRVRDGSIRDVEIYSGSITIQGKSLLYSIVDDVTERKKELERAASIQKHRLSTSFPLEDKASLSSIYLPSLTVSGDFYQLLRLDDHRVVGILGDVSGKGVTAALNVTALKVLFSDGVIIDREPVKILEYLNRQVIRHFDEDYVASCCFLFDFERMQATVAGAGINQFIFSRYNGSWSSRTVKGPFLGMFKDSIFEQQVISFRPHDKFYFYTDGMDFIFDDASSAENCRGIGTCDKLKIFLDKILSDKDRLDDDCTWLGIEIK